MATFSPNITITTSPVTVTSANGNVTYQTLQNSLGSYVYMVERLFFQSQTSLQQIQPFQLTSTNENGTTETNMAYSGFSLFQKVFASTTEFKENEFTLDGFTNMNFTILPNEDLVMVFDVVQLGVSDGLQNKSRQSPIIYNDNLEQVVNVEFSKPLESKNVKSNNNNLVLPIIAATLITIILFKK